MEFFGHKIKIERVDEEERELEEAFAILKKHGYRAVKLTADKSKKVASAAKANEAKQEKTREKIQNGLNLWRMEGEQDKELTAYKLAQLSGVSKNTAKKFLDEIKARSANDQLDQFGREPDHPHYNDTNYDINGDYVGQ